jgi:deoxyhypusine synthase
MQKVPYVATDSVSELVRKLTKHSCIDVMTGGNRTFANDLIQLMQEKISYGKVTFESTVRNDKIKRFTLTPYSDDKLSKKLLKTNDPYEEVEQNDTEEYWSPFPF